MDVDHRPWAQTIRGALGFPDHVPAVGGDPVVMEDRLDQVALAPVQFALGREETVAEHPFRVLKRGALAEVPVPRRQHVPDQGRLVHEPDRDARDRDAHDVSQSSRGLEQRDRVAPERVFGRGLAG